MEKLKKLSKSKASLKCFSKSSRELSAKMTKDLLDASEIANEKILENNKVYASSNQHAFLYPTKR